MQLHSAESAATNVVVPIFVKCPFCERPHFCFFHASTAEMQGTWPALEHYLNVWEGAALLKTIRYNFTGRIQVVVIDLTAFVA